jgi:hypothetical protein
MAMSAVLLGSGVRADGNSEEVYSCYLDGTTGTLQLPSNRDWRNVAIRQTDTRNAAGSTTQPTLNVATGVVTLTGIAVAALTGVSGGSAGTHTFTGTGGIIGTAISGDANLPTNAMVVNVSGTTITLDKPLLGAIAAGNQYSHMVVEVIYGT